ncbi:MAG TPA: GtrA family protein [Candidatus Avibacteroides faecavium]|nr:GtrA family protein [Candidatus Avibacteroides faecavium]
MKKESPRQLIRFCIIGMLNGGITYLSLFFFSHIVGLSVPMSNFIGYLLVLVHSYIWSRAWIFKPSDGGVFKEFILFTLTFLIAYTLQFITFYSLAAVVGVNKYWANLVSLVVFGGTNFVVNKNYTFKHKS